MSTEENKRIVRRFYEEIDKGNLDAMDQLVAEDYQDHNPPPFPGLRVGRDGLKQVFEIFWKATPGYHKIEDQIAEEIKSSHASLPTASMKATCPELRAPATT